MDGLFIGLAIRRCGEVLGAVEPIAPGHPAGAAGGSAKTIASKITPSRV